MNNTPAPAPASGKTLGPILTLVQVAGVVALVIWAIMLKRDLGVAEEQLAELRHRPAPDGKVEKENAALRNRVAALEAEAAAAANVAATAAAKPAAAPVASPPAPASPMAALVASMNNNPAMRNMLTTTMATTQRRMLETRLADFFTQLQFSPEQRARFLDMVTEAQAPTMDAALKLASGTLTPAEQAAFRQQANDGDRIVDAKIREFLGDDAKFAAYKQFTEQQTERTQVTNLNTSLAQSGQPPLSADQSAALTALMYAERKSFPLTPTMGADPANPLAAPSAEAIAARLREQEQLQNRIADRAASVLSPEQLAILRRDQATRLEASKASSEMMRQMLGGAQPAAK